MYLIQPLIKQGKRQNDSILHCSVNILKTKYNTTIFMLPLHIQR